MKSPLLLAAAALVASPPAFAAPTASAHRAKPHEKAPPKTPAKEAANPKASAAHQRDVFFHPGEVRSTGTVIVGGQPIAYDSVAGTLVVHAKDWEDTDATEAN